MNIMRFRSALVAGAAFVGLFAGASHASAAVYVGVRVGGPPPPPPVRVDGAWASPYRGAVWIPAHNEWINGRWVWVRGYYTYPPRRGGYWVPAYYRHGYYYPGRWGY
jgi:hypothetical protein